MDEKDSETSIQENKRDQTTQDVEKLKVHLGSRPECFNSTLVEILFILVCTIAIAMQGFLTGSIFVVSKAIAADLRMNQAETTWLVAATSLASGAFLLFFGRLTDLCGRKVVLVVSLFLFAVLCLAAGFAKNGITLDSINGLLGLISASSVPPAVGFLGNLYPRPSKRKNYAFACFSAGNPLGFVFGTVVSGIAAQIFNWRASFWLLSIIYLVASIFAYFATPSDISDKLPLNRDTFKRFDVVGALLTISGIGIFTCALSLGGDAPQGWKTPYVLVLLILGFLIMVVFVFWELKYPYPLLPMWIWKDRDFTLLTVMITIGTGTFASLLFWSTIYMQTFWTGSALHVAAYVLPCAISGILANIFAGMLLHRIPGKLIMGVSCAIFLIAFVLFGCNRQMNGYWPFVFPGLAIITWAVDLQFNVVNMYIISTLSGEQQGIAGGILQTTTRLGASIGLTLTTAIYNAIDVPTTGYYKGDASAKWAATYWFEAGLALTALCMVPFLRVGTQGNEKAEKDEDDGATAKNKDYA